MGDGLFTKDSELIEELVIDVIARFLKESTVTGGSAQNIVDAVVDEFIKKGFDRISVENGIVAGMLIQLAIDFFDSQIPYKKYRVERRRAQIALKIAEKLD